ncbi:MAG: hypothetical protein H7Y06_12460, partial [Opitutaceae bacterium]|nr:hypothetical protein [Opitutaceae bacterium]
YDQSGTATPGTRNAGYNFGFSAVPSNRLLGVSPTGNGASFMQLRLRNDTGAPVTNLTVQYTFRIMSPWTANELHRRPFRVARSDRLFRPPPQRPRLLRTGRDAQGPQPAVPRRAR